MMMAEAFFADLASRQIMTEKVPYAINIGCGDGMDFNDPVYPLYKAGFIGVAIDGYDHKGLHENLGGFDVMKMPGTFLSNENVVGILAAANCPKRPSFLKIDIDGTDADILRTILASGIRPIAIQAEVNAEIPPPYAFSVCASAKFVPGSEHNFYGFSLSYGVDLLSSFGYKLVNLDFETGWTHDGLWVDEDMIARLGIIPLDPRVAFLERPPFLFHIEAVPRDLVVSWRTRGDLNVVRNEIWTTMIECCRLKLGHADVPFELYISRDLARVERSENERGISRREKRNLSPASLLKSLIGRAHR